MNVAQAYAQVREHLASAAARLSILGGSQQARMARHAAAVAEVDTDLGLDREELMEAVIDQARLSDSEFVAQGMLRLSFPEIFGAASELAFRAGALWCRENHRDSDAEEQLTMIALALKNTEIDGQGETVEKGVEALIERFYAVRGVLRRFVEHEDKPCRFDHHGNCQEHGSESPCAVSIGRKLLGIDDG